MRHVDRICPSCEGKGVVALVDSGMTFEDYTERMTTAERAAVTDESPMTCGVCGGDGDLPWCTDAGYARRVRLHAA